MTPKLSAAQARLDAARIESTKARALHQRADEALTLAAYALATAAVNLREAEHREQLAEYAIAIAMEE